MKTYKFKLYRTKKQKHLHRRVKIAGEIYNHQISLHKRFYRLYGKFIDKYALKRHITKIKKLKKNQHWKQVGSQAIQDITFRIDYGYQKFFKKENKRPPTFRKLNKFKSFTLTQAGWHLNEDNSLIIGKHKFKFWKSQVIQGKPKLMHVKRDSLGDFYVFIVTDFEEEKPDYPLSRDSVGIDFGLKKYLNMSDGNDVESPEFYKLNKKDITNASRKFSRTVKGSKNKKKALKNLARVHKKVVNRRKDWQFKTARDLSLKYGAIFLEDLNIAGMKKLWGRKVSDLAFYSHVQIMKSQCAKTGTIVHQIDRWFPSSKTCNVCGTINKNLTLRDREWTCDCGEHHDRDKNASINIKNEGMSSFGLDTISRESLACVA